MWNCCRSHFGHGTRCADPRAKPAALPHRISRPGARVLPEPVKVITTVQLGDSVKLIGEGINTGQVHQPVLSAAQVAELEPSPETPPFDGDAARFRLGIEAMRLGLAYEYDPYFSLSIARVDPLPHQLEVAYPFASSSLPAGAL